VPFSRALYDGWVRKFVNERYEPDRPIIDIGAGAGKYGILLHDKHPNIDALEAEPSYPDTYGLKFTYRQVFTADAAKFDYRAGHYALAILGDTLECLTLEDARKLLEALRLAGTDVLVLVPFDLNQGAWRGHESERFRQPNLTAAIMAERYPDLLRRVADPKGGVYFRSAQ
jgi:hypothetical protein